MTRLRRSSPEQRGWTRRRAGKGFLFLDADGRRLPPEDATTRPARRRAVAATMKEVAE